uniref:Uncharacterized protein n=1 Tax=Anguilla anguilla TaxID=7936 RepID=A0A0E9WNF8_ANGAN
MMHRIPLFTPRCIIRITRRKLFQTETNVLDEWLGVLCREAGKTEGFKSTCLFSLKAIFVHINITIKIM